MSEDALIRKTIEQQHDREIQFYATGDADALATLFTFDAWQMLPNSPPLVGREEIRTFWRDAMRWGQWRLSVTVQAIEARELIAIERGRYVMCFVPGPGAPTGMVSREDRGNYLMHWRCESDREWRVAIDAVVSELPTPATHPGS